MEEQGNENAGTTEPLKVANGDTPMPQADAMVLGALTAELLGGKELLQVIVVTPFNKNPQIPRGKELVAQLSATLSPTGEARNSSQATLGKEKSIAHTTPLREGDHDMVICTRLDIVHPQAVGRLMSPGVVSSTSSSPLPTAMGSPGAVSGLGMALNLLPLRASDDNLSLACVVAYAPPRAVASKLETPLTGRTQTLLVDDAALGLNMVSRSYCVPLPWSSRATMIFRRSSRHVS